MRTATLCLLALSRGCATAQAQEHADALFHRVRDALQAKAYRIRDLQIGGGGPQPRLYSAPQARTAAITQPAVEPGTSQRQVTVSGTIQLQ